MKKRLGFLKHPLSLVIVAVVALSAGVWGLYPRQAHAQTFTPGQVYFTGHYRQQEGEHVLIGLLLPAVQSPRSPWKFSLLDSGGTPTEFSQTIDPRTQTSAFFDIWWDAGIMRVRDLEGTLLGEVPSTNGILIGLLVPAVKRNGTPVPPLSATVQAFDANGKTVSHFSFGCDNFAR